MSESCPGNAKQGISPLPEKQMRLSLVEDKFSHDQLNFPLDFSLVVGGSFSRRERSHACRNDNFHYTPCAAALSGFGVAEFPPASLVQDAGGFFAISSILLLFRKTLFSAPNCLTRF